MNRAGKYVSNMAGEMAYQSFCPAALPPEPHLEMNDEILRLLIEASRNLQGVERIIPVDSKHRAVCIYVCSQGSNPFLPN